jgi:predicted MFS family arabinose efflux permease
MTAETDRQHPSRTFLVLALGGISYSLLQSLVAPALPDIQHALHTTENSVSWVLTAYLLSASVATPLIGWLGDMHGKERLLMVVLAFLSVGTLVSAVASSLPLMLAGRVIQGAAGGIFPLAFGIIRDEFPRERVAAAIGLMSALRRRRRRGARRADRRPPLRTQSRSCSASACTRRSSCCRNSSRRRHALVTASAPR